jgi:hypothetical protein
MKGLIAIPVTSATIGIQIVKESIAKPVSSTADTLWANQLRH